MSRNRRVLEIMLKVPDVKIFMNKIYSIICAMLSIQNIPCLNTPRYNFEKYFMALTKIQSMKFDKLLIAFKIFSLGI
jgi:hypothetical protein